MFVDLRCRACGKFFHVDFAQKEFSAEHCPFCGNVITLNDMGRVRAVTEPFLKHAIRTNNIDICVVRIGTHNIFKPEPNGHHATGLSIDAGKLFYSDLEHLNDMYCSSSPEAQSVLSSLFDKFILLVDLDTCAGDVSKLSETLNLLRSLLKDRWKSRLVDIAKSESSCQE